MPNPSLPARLRSLAQDAPTDEYLRGVLTEAAAELEERAGRLCELRAELVAAQRWQRAGEEWRRVARRYAERIDKLRGQLQGAEDRAAARTGEVERLVGELARVRDLAEQAWGPETAATGPRLERRAHLPITLGPGMRIEPRRRAVLIRAAAERLAEPEAIVRCGPVAAAWRLKAVDYSGMDGDVPLFRVELEPVDAHAVPLDMPVLELPFPSSDLGWAPVEQPEAADEAMHRR